MGILTNRQIYFWNKMLSPIKNSMSVKKKRDTKLDDFRNNGKKFKSHFWEVGLMKR